MNTAILENSMQFNRCLDSLRKAGIELQPEAKKRLALSRPITRSQFTIALLVGSKVSAARLLGFNVNEVILA